MNHPRKTINNKTLKFLLLALGILSTGLGVLGIFLPLLPTVPLLLLATACFARSSDGFYNWLVNHRHLGPMIQGFQDGRGIPRKAKIKAIIMIWVSIPVSAYFIVVFWVKLILISIGCIVTCYLLYMPEFEPEIEEVEL